MTDSATPEFDMREFCAQIMREYEEVIATIIQRPVRSAAVEAGPGLNGSRPAEQA